MPEFKVPKYKPKPGTNPLRAAVIRALMDPRQVPDVGVGALGAVGSLTKQALKRRGGGFLYWIPTRVERYLTAKAGHLQSNLGRVHLTPSRDEAIKVAREAGRNIVKVRIEDVPDEFFLGRPPGQGVVSIPTVDYHNALYPRIKPHGVMSLFRE